MTDFLHFWAFFAQQFHKTYKITSYFYGMRKFVTKFFWSHGSVLGYLGPVSQQDPPLGFSRFQFLVIWGPNELPVLVASQTQAKKLKSIPAWCEYVRQKWKR